MIGTTAAFIAYALARGVTIADPAATVALTKATDYLNGQSWRGYPVDTDQDDSWPRVWLDINGEEVSNTPKAIEQAAYRLAMASADGIDLEPVYAGGKQIVEERVEGAIDVKYDIATATDLPEFPWFNSLVGYWLSPYGASKVNFSVSRG